MKWSEVKLMMAPQMLTWSEASLPTVWLSPRDWTRVTGQMRGGQYQTEKRSQAVALLSEKITVQLIMFLWQMTYNGHFIM